MNRGVPYRISRLGEGCAVVSFGNEIDPALNERALSLARELTESPFKGFQEAVPAYSSVAVFYDPLSVNFKDDKDPFQKVCGVLDDALAAASGFPSADRRTVEIPVSFGGESGPDLGFVAGINGISEDEVVRIFLDGEYRVYFLGFLPGFAYMGELDPQVRAPRKETPRTMVPKGSVGIAGSQTGIYPLDSPGGWQIIGRTEITMFDPDAEDPARLRPGDMVKFTLADI